MEIIERAVSAIATAYAAIVAKTFLIYTEKLTDKRMV